MKPFFRNIFILFIGSCLSIHALAQQQYPVRVELNANLDMEDYNLVPCGKNGLLVFFESEKKGNSLDTRVWNFAHYDKHLQQQWLADTTLIDGVKFLGSASDDHYTYLLFIDAGKAKSVNNLQILRVDYGLNYFSIINGHVPEKSMPVYFDIIENQAIIALNNNRFEPIIVFIDLRNGSLHTKKPEMEGLNLIQDISKDEDSNEIFVIVENYLSKKQNAILILQFDMHGQIKKTIRVNPAIANKVLNTARIADSRGDTLLILGTYHNTASKIDGNKEKTGPESAGFFVSLFIEGKELFIHYYNFLEFEEMYRSLSSKTIANLRRKAEKQKNKGEEYSLDYDLLLHDVIRFGNEYVLLAEAFYPEYRTVTSMYYDYYGRAIPQSYTVFDGYKYISGIAASFSPEGELLWDNGIEILNILTFKLNKYVSTYVNNDELALFYSNENRINYKIIGGENPVGSLQNISLESKYKGDKLMEDFGSKMIHWYANYFICYGYQKIRNNRISGGKRTVFYFSKLAFN
ncbi:MAG: hypothetical protein HQ565_01040 [Bacteroidetes bacterium]|nr:hypothetical protein [Bacteroidota bacterium]